MLESAPVRFVGNVEGRDFGAGEVDVVVTDGFTGNVVLKATEGAARAVGRLVLDALADDGGDDTFAAAAAAVLPKLAALRDRLDPEAYGGAHLVGVKGTVVIAHGSSSRLAIANALAVAASGAEQGLVAEVEAGLRG
jgi:glycerol-3-phosphate acyltransferase PlsX